MENLNLLDGDKQAKHSVNNKAPHPSGKLVLKTPKGTRDYDSFQMSIRKKVINIVVKCFEKYGAESIDTPVFELKELLVGKYGEDGGKLIYDLQDQGGEILSLRYDLTVPFARYLAMNSRHIKTVSGLFKRYHIGKVYRRDNPSFAKGRLREFYQCDFDIACLNYSPNITLSEQVLPEIECLRIVYEIINGLDLLNFCSDTETYNDVQLLININHRQLLEAILEICGVKKCNFHTVCSSIDKLDKTPWEDVKEELVTVKGISPDIVDLLQKYLELKGKEDLIETLIQDPNFANCKKAHSSLNELSELLKFSRMYEISEYVNFDLSLARGLDYYTGIIFEAVLVGSSEKIGGIGSIAGGGRYDDLVGLLDPKHKKIPCIGFSLGLERIFAILENNIKLKNIDVRTKATDVYVVSAQKNLLSERIKLCLELWNAGINAEQPLKENPKILSQFQYCEEYHIPFAVVIGESELKEGIVKLRNIETRQEVTIPRHNMIPEIKTLLGLPSNYTKEFLKF